MTKLRRLNETATIEHLRSAPGHPPAMAPFHSQALGKPGSLGGYSGAAGLTAKRWLLRLEGAAL